MPASTPIKFLLQVVDKSCMSPGVAGRRSSAQP